MTLIDDSSTVLDVGYLYYANGWLKEVQENSSSIAEYIYDEVGNRTRVDLGNGTYTTYDYNDTDPRYFVAAIGHYDSLDALLTSDPITYFTRDASGNPTVIKDWDDPAGRSYSYDKNNRLTGATGFDYNYDWVGNRLNPPASPNPMVYDATDKLVNWPGMQSFTYHPTGSLKEQKNTGGTVQKTWAYTGAELISAVTHAGVASPSAMEWDGDANRVSFTSSTAPTTPWHFIYDTAAGIPAVIEEQTPSGSVYYIREPGGQLIARVDGATMNYYHFDALGSTRFLSNGSGTVTDTYTYDAWGKQIASTGSTAQPYRYVGRFGYYSHCQDQNLFSEVGYQSLQLSVRLYDALTGRFIRRDPGRDGQNLYEYSRSAPTMRMDPTGLKCTPLQDPILLDTVTVPIDRKEGAQWRQCGWQRYAEGGVLSRGCYCYWYRVEYVDVTFQSYSYYTQKVSCMYRKSCHTWVRRTEFQPIVELSDPWTERVWPPLWRSPSCIGLPRTEGVVMGGLASDGKGNDDSAREWCMCKKPTASP